MYRTKTARLLRKLRARLQIAGWVKAIKKLVLETSARRQRYQFPIPPSSDVAIDPRVTTLYEKAANLVGMEVPTNKLVNLLGDEKKQLKVVSIVGFGGLGKTTLANEVYHRLKSDFDCGVFVTVSQKPDIPKLTHSLLSELGSGISFHCWDLNVLLNKVREYLQHKRCKSASKNMLLKTNVKMNVIVKINTVGVGDAPTRSEVNFHPVAIECRPVGAHHLITQLSSGKLHKVRLAEVLAHGEVGSGKCLLENRFAAFCVNLKCSN